MIFGACHSHIGARDTDDPQEIPVYHVLRRGAPRSGRGGRRGRGPLMEHSGVLERNIGSIVARMSVLRIPIGNGVLQESRGPALYL